MTTPLTQLLEEQKKELYFRYEFMPLEGNKRIDAESKEMADFLTTAMTKAHTLALEEVGRDKERLDFLDECNRNLNAHFGTTYGWELILNHNVTRLMSGKGRAGYIDIDLNDAKAHGAKSCREVIDAHIAHLKETI